ncbi:MAG: arylsulfatase [Lentisphaeria bacterium]|nr:arylsulfatase [Lentisphaeria bacterium]
MDQPNIVFVFCDDLGWGDVSCLNPESKIQTPHIDALAEAGVNFTDAHAGSAVCTPSRYTLMTGRYCWRTRLRHGVNGGYSPALLSPERLTVAGMLRECGYRTACVGKWHIGMDWQLKEGVGAECPQQLSGKAERELDGLIDFSKPVRNGPVDVGFDYYYGISASLDMSPYVFIENDQAVEIPCEVVPRGTAERRAREGIGAKGWRHEDVLPTLKRKSIEFIQEQAEDGTPFFLYVPLAGPHTPVVPNPEFIGKSDCGIYGDFVMEIDHTVGEIVQSLKDAGAWENTLFVFSSDNGPETITNPYREKYDHSSAWKFRGIKRDNWEGGHRVPFIVSWPGRAPAGTKCKRFVELADFMATTAEIVDYDLPDTAAEDSHSLLALLMGDFEAPAREFALHHSCNGQWAVRKGAWKLLLHAGSGGNRYDCPENDDPVQLYNLETDPFETTNVYRDHPEIVVELKMLCLKCIRNGRSTPGPAQANDEAGEWKQLQALLALE